LFQLSGKCCLAGTGQTANQEKSCHTVKYDHADYT
jgi:hypothetical protein